jgi:hypothetical protein
MPLPEHWSESVDWRPGRWDPMSNAPAMDAPLTEIRVRDAKGRIYEPVHWAQGGGEEQPPFRGWFVRTPNINYGVDPVEWQPLRASPDGVEVPRG